METFRFSGDYIELNRLLKASGLCDTGGRAKLAIEEGLVYNYPQKLDRAIRCMLACKNLEEARLNAQFAKAT